ncbi:hypothetical protein WJX82_007512 [Trebouxia sp. C0006]
MKKDRPDAEPEKVAELHGLAQRQPAHQSAQDMLSSRWANASWATALTAHLSQPGAQHASQHTAGKPVADSSRTPLLPGRGNPQNSTPADNAISRPGVATRIPNALFGTAPQIIRAVPRQVAATALLPPTGKAAKTAPLLPSRKSAVPSFMRPCSKPWGANKGGRAGGLSKTQGVPRGAKGSKGTGAAQREKFAKTSAMPEQARITGSQTRRDSLTDPPPPRSSSSLPASTCPASPQLAAQQNLSHGLSPPKLDQLPSELPLKQSVSHPPAMTHPPAVTHPPTASAQQPPVNAAPPRSSLKLPSQLPPQLPSQLPLQLPPATEAPDCSDDEKEVQQWHDLQKQKADALMTKILSKRTGDRSGKDLTDEELAQFQSQLLEQGCEEAKKLPDRLHPAKPPPCPTALPPPPKPAAQHLPNPLQLELVRADPLQPYICRGPPQRFSSLAQALQLITKRSVNPVVVHAAAALHARGATVLHRRKWESVDAAVFWVVLKECHAKPTNKQYADALLKVIRNKVSAPTISSGAKMLSDDSAFVSALNLS